MAVAQAANELYKILKGLLPPFLKSMMRKESKSAVWLLDLEEGKSNHGGSRKINLSKYDQTGGWVHDDAKAGRAAKVEASIEKHTSTGSKTSSKNS